MSSGVCPRCGLRHNGAVGTCLACGFQFEESSAGEPTRSAQRTEGASGAQRTASSSGSSTPTRFPTGNQKTRNGGATPEEPHTPVSPTKGTFGSTNWLAVVGWQTLTGRVIAIDQPYQVTRSTNWIRMLLMLPLIIFLLPLIISAILAAPIIRLMFSFMFPSFGEDRTQVQSGIGSQLLSYFLYGALFGPKKADTVRDIRLRDEHGQEQLVRIVGDLLTGNVNIGDEIVAVGWNKRGTLIFYRGRNLRTNSDILVRR